MVENNISVSRATIDLAVEISELLEANVIARGGELYGDWSEAVIRRWLDDGMPIFVVRVDGRVKAALLTSEANYLKSAPALKMVEAAHLPDDFYVYGPVCIASDARGAGMLALLWGAAKAHYADRRALLFINETNVTSVAAHAKLGMQRVGAFQQGGRDYLVFASS